MPVSALFLCYTDETMPTAFEQRHPPAEQPAYRIERVLRVLHTLDYHYTHPVRDVVTCLRLTPPAQRGGQLLRNSSLKIAPLPAVSERHTDPFGNEVLDLRHEKVWAHLTMVVDLEVATQAVYSSDGRVLPLPVPPAEREDQEAFKHPTPLTEPNAELTALASELTAQIPLDRDPAGLALALCRRVYHEMHYAQGHTNVRTTGAEAWAGKRGVCQDYTHVLLSLCRLAGLPARYVSGFLPGEGAMHAWAEVCLPAGPGNTGQGDAGGWVALDPTHDRWVNERYVAVAFGRDYADIAPTSGTFVGSGPGHLTHRSRVVVEQTVRTPLT